MNNLSNFQTIYTNDKIGIYVHLPFCIKKCPYCDFFSTTATNFEEYVAGILLQIEQYRGAGVIADTLYFGGGTPSLVPPKLLGKIIVLCKEIMALDGEITIECNPCSIDENKLIMYREIGINRISIGVQSFVSEELVALGRSHTVIQAKDAVNLALEYFSNVSVDIMLGVPYQTSKSLAKTLSLIDSRVKHISAYMLKVEPNTKYYGSKILDECVGDDDVATMYWQVCDMLDILGYKQYEISNFSKAGYESRHNLKYWELVPYLGFGETAHSFYNGERFYYKDGNFHKDGLGGDLEEYIMLSLRLNNGLNLDILKNKYNVDVSQLLIEIKPMEQEILYIDKNLLKLTRYGFLISNTVINNIVNITNKQG